MASQSEKKVFIVTGTDTPSSPKITSSFLTTSTGGASGIGLGITRYLSTQQHPTLTPAHIAIFDINAETGLAILSSLQAEYKSTRSATISFHQCDVSSWESQAAAFKEVVQQQGRVDYVVANAGITEKGDLLAKEAETEEPSKPALATLDVNLTGVIYCSSTYPFSEKKEQVADRHSNQTCNSLHPQKWVNILDKRGNHLHSLKCRNLPIPNGAYLRHDETWCRRTCALSCPSIGSGGYSD
ncbi:hypothetical protein EIK77_006614 [Talaromyces pinophilus]|nr:hypothetical protein EIK77_006614 [Talaromyces pinophilus]